MSSYRIRSVPRRGLRTWQIIEQIFDAAFGSAQSPLRHLGAIGYLALWLLIVSGVLLYIVFDTSVDGAWESVERLAHWPWGTGHLLRGLHHYAADLLILTVLLHILREWLHGHEQGVRRFHWLTGTPLLAFCFISAIGGFWLVWDQLGQYSAVSTAHWLDGLPLLASPLSRNFLSVNAVNDRLFSLFLFIHVGIPLLLAFGLWFHTQRLTHVAILPPRRLTIGIVLMLTMLALVRPVRSAAPAALDQVPAAFDLDWILLWLHPLTDATSREFTLALAGTVMMLLFALPFLSRPSRTSNAVVNTEHCSGCGYCFTDCPYAAITMVPHPHRQGVHQLAYVDVDLCIGCGICAGACPSSTPFRGITPLATGIDITRPSIDALRERLNAGMRASATQQPLVMFSCKHGASVSALQQQGLVVVDVVCAGQLPPSFVEYALRKGATGVLIASCAEGGCEFRLGDRWTAQRLARERDPRLRELGDAELIQLIFANAGDERRLIEAVRQRQQEIRDKHADTLKHANETIH